MVEFSSDSQSRTFAKIRSLEQNSSNQIVKSLSWSQCLYLAAAQEDLELLGQVPLAQRTVHDHFEKAAAKSLKRLFDSLVQHKISVQLNKLLRRGQ